MRAHGTVSGSALIVGEHLYVATVRNVLKLRAETGEVVWRASPGGTASPTYDDGVVFMHGINDQLVALDAATGDEMWKVDRVSQYAISAGHSSPLVVGRYVIIGTSSNEEVSVSTGATMHGEVVAYDKVDGEELWRHLVPSEGANGATVWSSPSADLDAEMVFVTTGNNYTGRAGNSSDSILALDLATGARIWTNQLTAGDVFTEINPQGPDYDFGANAIVFEAVVDGEMTQLVGAGQKSGLFHALRRDTGALVWSTTVSDGSALGGVLNNGAYDGERIYVAGNNRSFRIGSGGTLAALDPGSGRILWQIDDPGKVWAPVSVANGVGFVMFDRKFTAFEAATGRVLYEFLTPGTGSSAPVVSNGRVFLGSGIQFQTASPGMTFHAFKLPD